MSKATAAAAIAGGLLLALVGAVGTAALVVAAVVQVYSPSAVLWILLPVLFVAGVAAAVWGIARLLSEAGDLAGESLGGLSDVKSVDDLRDLRRLYRKLS